VCVCVCVRARVCCVFKVSPYLLHIVYFVLLHRVVFRLLTFRRNH